MTTAAPDIQGLIDALVLNKAPDGLTMHLPPAQWDALALYFVASGSLSVHFEDAESRIRLAIVGAGSVVGEGGFFTANPRSATVQASSTCTLWSLSSMRFTEMTHRKPELALAVAMGAGTVLAKRLMHSRFRVAVT